MSDIKVKKVAEDVWEATHVPTKLNMRSHNKLMAVFKLGALVTKQLELFEKQEEIDAINRTR